MWRKDGEEYKCPWRAWEECLKEKCPFYERITYHRTEDICERLHRCTRVLYESKGEEK